MAVASSATVADSADIAGALIREDIAAHIHRTYPEWSPDKFICQADLTTLRSRYVQSLLESEKGELTSLEREVLHSLQEHELLSANIEAEFEQEWSFGERLADKIA